MNLSPLPKQKFFGNDGLPLVGGQLFTYAAGTSTKVDTYRDSAGTLNTNPIVLDYRGECDIWLDPTLTYKFTLAPPGDTDPPTKPIWTVDNVTASIGITTLTQQFLGQIFYPRTSSEIAAGVTPTYYYYVPGDVRRYGADPLGVASSTSAIQQAISTGQTVYFYDGTYLASNLTGSANFQSFFGFGAVFIKKNANGDLLTHSGSDVYFENVEFRGDSSTPTFTGNNLVLTGERPTLINCSSQWAFARALKATGNRVRVLGSRGIYQTTDASASGYDIEIGTSGIATLYHVLANFNSSQSSGGILLTDTGSAFLDNLQIGKLSIKAGTTPAGVNGGITSDCRILGAVSVELSSAIFVGNQFSSIAVTFAVGTSGCSLDASNVFAIGATITNNGNGNNLIVKNISAGSFPSMRYGDDSSGFSINYDSGSGHMELVGGDLRLPNNKYAGWKDSGGNYNGFVGLTAGNNFQILNNNGSIQLSTTAGNAVQMLSMFAIAAAISPAQITANQNDYNPTGLNTANTLRLNTDAARNITGLQGGQNGRVISIYNVGTFNFVLTNQDAASSAANRFALGANLTIAPDEGCTIQYDSISSRWRRLG